MNAAGTPFLGAEGAAGDPDRASVAVLPCPYEGGVSYGRGAADGPAAILAASQHVELYDEAFGVEPFRSGIATLAPLAAPAGGAPALLDALCGAVGDLLDRGKFVVVLGGDHSISAGTVRAMARRRAALGVVQLDAHADLRDSYEGSPFSHASAMARILEITPHALQLGIRSMAVEEAQRVREENLRLFTMREMRRSGFALEAQLERLPDDVFLTIDVDVFDWSVVRSTGTPEPGGLLWDEALDLLRTVFRSRRVIGIDVVELAGDPADRNSAFAMAKLIHRMLAMRIAGAAPAARQAP